MLPILGFEFLGLSVLELCRGTRQTDGQTDIGQHFIMPLIYGGRGIISTWGSIALFLRVGRRCDVNTMEER